MSMEIFLGVLWVCPSLFSSQESAGPKSDEDEAVGLGLGPLGEYFDPSNRLPGGSGGTLHAEASFISALLYSLKIG